MNKLTRIIFTTHRVLGTLLSALFVVWFLSGLVMIYQSFPSVRMSKTKHQAVMSVGSQPSIDAYLAQVAPSDTISGIRLYQRLNQTVAEVRTTTGRLQLLADSTDMLRPVNRNFLDEIASLWSKAAIARIDTLMELDQFIPFGQLRQSMPILRYHFDDDKATQLYISTVTGEPLQCTTRSQRFWSWLGPIPHWVYFTQLRQDADTWSWTVFILGLLGVVMTVCGLYVGFYVLLRRHKAKGTWESPYKKRFWWWHHVTGLLFGVFVLTWIFSGMMSVASLPEWVAPSHKEYGAMQRLASVDDFDFALDYRKAVEACGDSVCEVEWSTFAGHKFYTVTTLSKKRYIDASNSIARPLCLTKEEIERAIRDIHPGENVHDAVQLDDYDTYYGNRKMPMPLPVWKVEVDNDDRTCYYIDPATARVHQYNTRSRINFWTYPGLHSLRFAWLTKQPVVWHIVMWLLMLGGTAVSGTGLVLGCKYIKRLISKKK